MGRKRSKTQKQKQQKATNKLAKAFGKKMGMNDVDSKMKIDVGGVSNSSSKSSLTSSQKLLRKIAREKQKKAAATSSDSQSSSSTKKQQSPHMRDFVRQQASLREREMRIEWKRNTTKRNRSATAATKIHLTPASFAATDAEKPTDQLIGETTQKVSNWNGLEQQQQSAQQHRATPTKQLPSFSTPFSTPLAQSSPWTAEEDDGVANNSNNPWAVLADEDEENEQHHSQQKQPQSSIKPIPTLFAPTSQFAFAAPTFLAPSSAQSLPTNDVDPDL